MSLESNAVISIHMRLYTHYVECRIVNLLIYTNTLIPKACLEIFFFFFTLVNSLCVKYIFSYIRLAEGGWKIVLLWVKRFEANVN